MLSEIRNPSGNPTVKQIFASIPDEDLYLSALTIGEIAKGIALLPAGKRKIDLLVWFDGLQQFYSERILPVDHETAMLWGNMTARLQLIGIGLPAIDGLIAATAIQHGLHLMSRNTKHFEATGALIIDPWQN